jgi:hypothetical protein
VVVARSANALAELGVRDDVAMREDGICGVRVGTAAAELRRRFGEPTGINHAQAAGCVDEHYGGDGGLDVHICADTVASVHARRCPK